MLSRVRSGPRPGSHAGGWPAAALLAAGMVLGATLSPLAAQQTAGNGFLFTQPAGTITFHGGFAKAGEGSEIFEFSREQLTLDEGAFDSFTLYVEYAHRLAGQLDVFGGVGFAGGSERSEFRDFMDQDGLPIEQTSRLTRIPLTAGIRAYVLPRGRTLSRLAWVPSTYSPYLTAGGGIMWYSFRQSGDFVDFEDFEIFTESFESAGWAPTLFGGAGLDVSISPKLALVGEGRYSWGRASMGDDFSGFDDIDLSGFTATIGLRIRF